jgi:DNA-binding response OmpR family regulator
MNGAQMIQQIVEGEIVPGGRRWPQMLEPQPPRRVWSLNVLLVDDDAADTSLILNVLKRHPHVASAQATDAPEFALRQLEVGRLRPDLVLLDIHMPRLDGFRFLQRMRDIPTMYMVPVVFLTTSRLSSDAMRTKISSASLYIIKPDTYLELQARLNGVLRRASSGRWSH